ncbi:futalosine hydrolase [Sphingobacterium deserti]|uniref:Futalosine hydrolase n=1 Tax=Sphingobacterium deserti TaxID=1229276 RepID=A0A0B8T7M6_9SPHI|nr:futalosine hydrolase [Sphingobacterium deserti]KGE14524.1 purine or other phosphorylase family 1 [Sphingobacterium deserti]
MNILVVAATKEEIVHSIPFLEENDVPYLISGVGMVSTTYTLTKALQTNKPDLLIQVGIGGILDTNAALGAVYQIETDEIFELGAEDRKNFISIEQLGFGKHRFTGRAPLLSKRLPEVPKAHGITVNKVHGSEESISRLLSRYNQPVVESMEGSALFFVSEQEQIPALQYRAISNYIEPRNKEMWQIGLAVKNINVFLRELLVHLL